MPAVKSFVLSGNSIQITTLNDKVKTVDITTLKLETIANMEADLLTAMQSLSATDLQGNTILVHVNPDKTVAIRIIGAGEPMPPLDWYNNP